MCPVGDGEVTYFKKRLVRATMRPWKKDYRYVWRCGQCRSGLIDRQAVCFVGVLLLKMLVSIFIIQYTVIKRDS